MDMLSKAIKQGECLFFVIYFLYCVDIIIGASVINIPGVVIKLLRLAFVLLAMIKIINFDNYSTQQISIIGIVLVSLLLMRAFGGYSKPIWTIIMIFSAYKVEFKSILKMTLFNIVCLSGVVICACLVGAIPDYTYIHNLGDRKVLAHSLGFNYYSTLAYYAMTLTIAYIYLRNNRLRYEELACLMIANVLFYQIHTTRVSFYLTILFVVIYYTVVKRRLFRFYNHLWKTIATCLPYALFGGTFLLIYLYQKGILALSSPKLRTVVSRIRFSIRGFDEYGLKFFGSKFAMIGNTDLMYGSASKGWYIDSAFVYIVLAYGIVFSVILIGLYTVVYRHIYCLNDDINYIWMGMILLGCCINNFILSPVINPLLFLIPEAVSGLGSDLKSKGGYSEQVKSTQYTEY